MISTNAGVVGQDILEVRDCGQQLFVFVFNLLAFQSGQTANLHGEDRLGLQIVQTELRVHIFNQTGFFLVGGNGSG